MDKTLEIPPHIAASDFDDHWQGSAASGHGYVPLRMEFKHIGVIKTSAAGEGKVDLCWSSDDGRRLPQGPPFHDRPMVCSGLAPGGIR
jgi:hypothetical protein